MNKDEKIKAVEQLQDRLTRSSIVVLFDYKGITVDQVNGLRRSLEKVGDNELKVVKNTLARRAVDDTERAGLKEFLVGPNAMLFVYGDPVPPVKALVDTTKGIEAIQIKSAVIGARTLSEMDIKALAQLPGREQLLAQLFATMQAPTSGFVTLLSQVPRGLLNVLVALKDKKDQEAAA